MRMRLNQEQSIDLRQVVAQGLSCTFCDGSLSNHSSRCVLGRLEALQDKLFYVDCPLCKERKVTVNDQDFWQCYACDAVMTSSRICIEEGAKIKFLFLNIPGGDLAVVARTHAYGPSPRMNEKDWLMMEALQRFVAKIRLAREGDWNNLTKIVRSEQASE